jgi:hypothetical protein
MAKLKATAIYNYGDGVYDRQTLEKHTAGDNIEVGDFLKANSSNPYKVQHLDQETTDEYFVGVSGTLSADADGPTDILVYTKCIVEVPANSAHYKFSNGLKYDSANGTVAADGDTNTIAWVWEGNTGGSATSVKALVDVVQLGKLFDVG